MSDSPLGRWLRQLKPTAGAAPGPQVTGRSTGGALKPSTAGPGRPLKLHPGAVVGGYRVVREVGRGAMATVYEARQDNDGERVALKVLSVTPDGPDEHLDDARMRLLREAEAAGRIQHPGIVQVRAAGEDLGIVYLAMEFVEGVSLATHAVEGRLLPARLVAQMCAKVADCLGFAHGRGVVHRDVKPANLVYDPRSRSVRVMDFGVARITDSSATSTGIILGSPSYMAPEQLEGRPLTGQSDLFSLGVTLFQLLTAQLPFRGDSIPGLMQRIATEPHPPLGTIRPDLPARIGQIIDRSLEKDPARRYATGAEMATALQDAARDVPAGVR